MSECTGDGRSSKVKPTAPRLPSGDHPDFQLLVNAIRDYALYTLDPDGYITSWNAGAERIKGYREHEIVGKHFSVFYTQVAVDSGHPERELLLARRTGRYEEEGWRVRRDGSVFWANVIITPIREESGKLRGFAKITRDMTARKAMEESLRESEERFRLLIEGVREYAIFMTDPDGYITTWNAGAMRIKGYQADEIIGEHVSCFYPPDRCKQGQPASALEAATLEGRYEEEGLRIKKDGSLFWAHLTITAIRDNRGVIKGFANIVRDITERKESERRLKQVNEELERRVDDRTSELERREYQLRALTNALPVLIAQLDADLRYVFVNEAYQAWYGKKEAEILGRHASEVIGPEALAKITPHIMTALSGTQVSFETHFARPAGETYLNISYLPFPGEDDASGGILMLATDVTFFRLSQKELQKAKEASDSANASKSAFLANMSHEIRTPLGVMIGLVELLMNPSIAAEERANALAVIKRNGELLSDIINDILDLSKIEAGKLEVERNETSLNEVINDISALLNLKAAEKGIALAISPDGPVPTQIMTDSLRLKQILLNVIGNAIKFTERGAVSVKIKMQARDDQAGHLIFTVKDTGIGISEEKAQCLFEAFTQADASTTRRFGGTGLGLVLSKRLAQALGGDLVLTASKPGVGSEFTITIDAGKNRANLPQGLAFSPKPRGDSPSVAKDVRRLQGCKILLVEDTPDIRFMMSRTLSIAGAAVALAENGRQAVDLARNHDYDVILMDLQMPQMSGIEATQVLRDEGYSRPIVALTAHALKEERNRCLERGFDEYVSKPINFTYLFELLERYKRQTNL